MKKILYLILHTSVYAERYYNIKETWGKDVDCLFYSDHQDLDKNIVKVSERSDYFSNEEKHVGALRLASEKVNDYEWFFFCDDDTFVNTKKMQEFLETSDKGFVHGLILNGAPTTGDLTLDYCSGGAGYLIHSSIIKLIGKEIIVVNSGYSDVTLGLFLRHFKVPLLNSNLFNSQPPDFYKLKSDEIKNRITFHYIKTMSDMQNLFNNTK